MEAYDYLTPSMRMDQQPTATISGLLQIGMSPKRCPVWTSTKTMFQMHEKTAVVLFPACPPFKNTTKAVDRLKFWTSSENLWYAQCFWKPHHLRLQPHLLLWAETWRTSSLHVEFPQKKNIWSTWSGGVVIREGIRIQISFLPISNLELFFW